MLRNNVILLALGASLTACQTAGVQRTHSSAAFENLPSACYLRADLGAKVKYERQSKGDIVQHLVQTNEEPFSREVSCMCSDKWKMERADSAGAEKVINLIAKESGSTVSNFKPVPSSDNVYSYNVKRIDMWGDTLYSGRAIFEGNCIHMVGAWGRPTDAMALERFAASAYDARQARPASNPTVTPTPSAMESRSIAVRWEGITDLMAGTVQFEERAGTGRVAFAFPDKSATCSGTFQAKDRASGAWSLACSNGKAASGSYKALGAGQGSVGEGKDVDGKAVQFTVGARG